MSLTHDTTSATSDHELQHLRDRLEVTDLVSRLGVCLDEGRFDAMRSLFVEDATARTPGGYAEDRDALIAQASRNHTPDQRIQHVITDVLVDLDTDTDTDRDHGGGSGRAEVRANLVVAFASLTELPAGVPAPTAQYVLGEVYRFEVVRTPDGWRFAQVEATPLWRFGTPPTPPQPA